MTGPAALPAPTIDDPAYFDRLAEVETSHWWSSAMWRIASLWLDRALSGRIGLVALDVGCGTGGAMRRLTARTEIASVVGLDPSPSALDRAGNDDLILGSACNLPFADGSFDLTTSFDVLQHLAPGGDRRAAAEMLRVLRPGGIAVLRANGQGLWPGTETGSRPYRLAELRDVMLGAGFRVVAASYANCLPAVAAEIAGRLRNLGAARPSRRLGHPSGGGLRIRLASPARNRMMGAVAAVEALTVGRFGVRLPVGHSTMLLAEKRGGRR